MIKKITIISLCILTIAVGIVLYLYYESKTHTTCMYLFDMTDEWIQVTLDISDEEDDLVLTPELQFRVLHNDEILSQGIFITKDAYYSYTDVIKKSKNAKIINSGKRNENEFLS